MAAQYNNMWLGGSGRSALVVKEREPVEQRPFDFVCSLCQVHHKYEDWASGGCDILNYCSMTAIELFLSR